MRFLIILVFVTVIFSIIYASDETASVEVKTTTVIFTDFNDVIPEIDASAHYHWFFVCGARVYKWNGGSWVLKSKYYEVDSDYPYDGYEHNWSVSDEPVPANDLGQYGDGDYQLRFLINVNFSSDMDIFEFQVDDVTAPGTPSNLAVEEVGNHPYLTWDKNSEIDVENYNIYKKIGSGSWNYFTNTPYLYFTDEDELMNGSQQYPYPTIVQYKITAEDYTANESGFSTAVQCTCKGSPLEGTLSRGFSDKQLSNLNSTPTHFQVDQNYPNPFNPETKISFGIPEDNFVNLIVYNIQGEKIATLVNEPLTAGTYTAKFDGSQLPSGVYIYKVQAGSYSQIKRMLLIK